MRPSEWRGVRQKIGRAIQSLAFSAVYGLTEVLGVPVDDDGGEQIEAGHAEMLAFGGAITDFTLATDAKGVFQGMMRLAFVQADLGTALHVGIEQPVDDEECLFYPSISRRANLAADRASAKTNAPITSASSRAPLPC